MSASKRNIVFFLILTTFFSKTFRAQGNLLGYFQPGVELSYQVASKYSHSFAIDNRNFIYRNDEVEYNVQQIDFSHLSEYQWKSSYALGFGLKYRLENAFDTDEENELRLQQQVVYTPQSSNYKASHRFRSEQRFYESITKHRFRYQLAYSIPLAQENPLKPYMKVGTESLLEVAKIKKPKLEQRFGIGFGWLLTPKTRFKLGVEYQLADYAQDLEHELFLLADFGIKL